MLPELDRAQQDRLRTYLETLLLWRDRVALISTADPVRLVEHHILDALHVTPQLVGRRRLADIGSGAGLPGIPLAIALPAMETWLIESRRKKANFLRQAKREAGLGNAKVVEGRAEDVAGASFDAVTSRALGSVETFLALGSSLLERGGLALAMRGPHGGGEGIEHPDFEAPSRHLYRLAMGRERVLLIYRRL